MGLRNYTIKRKSQGIYTAFNSDMLGPTISKVWDGMEFLNTCTGGGLKHLRMVKNTADIKRASQKLKDGTEVGFKSEIRTVITDNPRKLRGSRVERLFFEEAGSHPELLRTYTQAEALVEIGGTKVGIRLSWGTGGDHGPALAGLATIFYNPEAYKVLPYRNNFNMKREYVLTGFFIPAYHMVWNKMDHRGFCSETAGREYYDKERMRKSKDAQALMAFKSEFCYFPEEALIREGSNRFDAEKIAEQITNIELHKTVEQPIRGRLSWPLNKETGNVDMNQTPVFTPDPNGKILITEYPMSDDKGIVYNQLYVSGLDSIDSDTSSSSGQSDVSDFCILIKKRTFGLSEPKYVAMYKDRPRDIRTAYDNAIKLLMWYNAKCVVEATRVGIITYFKEKNKLNLLFKRPRATLANQATRNINQYGTPATPAIIEHQLELIEMFIQDYCYSIQFLEMLQELLKYSYENKRKFDIVAAMGLTELADEELFSRPPRAQNNISNNWKDVGYYYDNGVKKFGVIPANYNKEDNMIRNNYDWIRI